MSFFISRLKRVKPTQVLSQGMDLSEVVKEEVAAELRGKFPEALVVVSNVTFQIIPKEDTAKPEAVASKKPQEEKVTTPSFLTIEHPSQDHQNKKITAISSNNATVIEKLLK